MSRFVSVYEFGLVNFNNQDYMDKINLFGKSYKIRIQSGCDMSTTKSQVNNVNKILKSDSTTMKICKLAIGFIKSSYGKTVTADVLIKKVKPIALIIEDYGEVAIICDYDPWTNAGLGIQILPELDVSDRAAFC